MFGQIHPALCSAQPQLIHYPSFSFRNILACGKGEGLELQSEKYYTIKEATYLLQCNRPLTLLFCCGICPKSFSQE